MRCALRLPQGFGEPAGRHYEQHDECDLGHRRDEKQPVRPAGKAQQRHRHEAAGKEADREAEDDAWEENPDLLNVEQPPGLPTDEDEADLEQDRKEHEQRRGDPNARPQCEHRPRAEEQKPDDGLDENRNVRQRPVPDNPRDPRGDERPEERDRDERDRKPPRPVRGEEDRTRRDHEERLAQTEHERLCGQQPDHTTRVVHSSTAERSAPSSAPVRRRRTSALITSFASSGRSASNSSRTALRSRRSSVGPTAVTDADRGPGTSTASSPTDEPAPSSPRTWPSRCTRTRPLTTTYSESSNAPRSMNVEP